MDYHNKFLLYVKYILDKLIALCLLLLLSPLLIGIALVILLNEKGSVFFIQTRPGLSEKPFKLLKFRTMRDIYDENGKLLPDEERITAIGNWLRRASLDELPQFFNVLKGDMSIVGPRPLLMEYLPLYNQRQRLRHSVKPGVTGWAQIKGRNEISWEKKFEFDVWYVENWSLGLDVKIILLTLIKVLKREGISQRGEATMEKFRGNQEKSL